jgi:hypothetical protein
MATKFTTTRKFAGLGVMATAVIAVGLGLGSGTAQAQPKHPNPHPHTTITSPVRPMASPVVGTFNQRVDNFLDGIQGLFGVGQGTPFDNHFDAFFGVS